MPDMEPNSMEHYYQDDEYPEEVFSVCAVPGEAPSLEVQGVDKSGDEKTFRISQYKGRYLIILFHNAVSPELVSSFTSVEPLIASSGADLVCSSTDSIDTIKSRAMGVPQWSDPSGSLATLFDLYDSEQSKCLDGVVIIDDHGVIRQVMVSSMEAKDLAANVVSLVGLLKKHKVDLKSVSPTVPSSGMSSFKDSGPRVKIDVSELEKDWDVSADPELQKVLNVAKLLGRTAPPTIKNVKKVPMFNLLPDQIRMLKNPRATVKSVMASLQRNLAGFGPSADISANQKIQLENIMKKVMGVAYMPEELNGTFTTLRHLDAREQKKLLGGDVFQLTGDDWLTAPGAKTWSEGQGVFVNNYNNFVLWVNLEDQLRLVSVSRGQDLKYVLLRLQKAVARIEEALKMIISAKSCQQRGFTTSDGKFAHSRREVYGTGLEVVITMDLVGLTKAGKDELDKARKELGLKIEKSGKGAATFSVIYNQSPDDNEEDIVSKTVEAVDNLARYDHELQSRLGVKLTL